MRDTLNQFPTVCPERILGLMTKVILRGTDEWARCKSAAPQRAESLAEEVGFRRRGAMDGIAKELLPWPSAY